MYCQLSWWSTVSCVGTGRGDSWERSRWNPVVGAHLTLTRRRPPIASAPASDCRCPASSTCMVIADHLIPCSCLVMGYPLAPHLFLVVGIAPFGRAPGVQVGSLGRPAQHARLGGVIAPCAPVPWKVAAMPDEHRLTIRLPQELYAQLASCGWPGQPLAAIVRHALQEYVARQTGQPRSLDNQWC